ncbi:ATP synthase F0 subunit C [candidate division WOR-1 bacterium RIFCSPHIGHO2_01_FULL_53_15]|uniref:ATP synthase subunit c n=1 Tax=candidate division WOR-1 bacterium RIFCSPHIGHO2_01_FULL_53_15 TaxID=1802564 RepID=A0A1F4Q138_UNCSA|nr:MAG: ATP synthase F0 subunit C [candidate division WOR-1 bacterium RIFCSPHIGHO2_01_FULL_53_15]OGC12807.1 MAG: ATP synthase F0 subunit C [candidate division WOR-1 bacterium RIFCSPHIGHO2_02_FULL_53_26]
MDNSSAFLAAGLGMSIAALGTAIGIGMLASKALEGMARQPEAAGNIRTAMILAIAFVEAIALYALVVCLILATKG